jgi:MFS family permease
MELFSGQDVAAGFGAVLHLLFDTGLIWILLLGIGATIVADVFAPRRSKPSRKKPKTRGQTVSRDISGASAAGTALCVVLLMDVRSTASNGWFWVLTLPVVGGWVAAVVVLYRKKKQGILREFAQLDIDEMIHIPPDEFEVPVADLFRAKPYWAQVVGSAGGFWGRRNVRSAFRTSRSGCARLGYPLRIDLLTGYHPFGLCCKGSPW